MLRPIQCAALLTVTNRRLCYLNVAPDEVIRSLFYNQQAQQLITGKQSRLLQHAELDSTAVTHGMLLAENCASTQAFIDLELLCSQCRSTRLMTGARCGAEPHLCRTSRYVESPCYPVFLQCSAPCFGLPGCPLRLGLQQCYRV